MSDKMQNSGGEGSSEKKGIFAVGGGKTDGVVKIRRRSLPVVICVYVHTAHPTVQDALLLPQGISAQAQQAAEGFIFQKKIRLSSHSIL